MTNRIGYLKTGIFAVIGISILLSMVLVNVYYIRLHPVEKKFLTPWLGMRTFLEIGSDPYGEPATQRTQLIFYGDLAEDGQDPLILNQPFASTVLYFPFALISNYTTARVVWMVLLELILIGSAVLSLNLFGWKLPILLKIVYILGIITSTYAMLPLLDNSQVIIVFFLLLLGFYGLQKGLDELSGAAFALILFQPSVTGIFCLMSFWWVIKNRRWRVLGGSLMAWGFLIATSFALFPGWFLPFIRAFRAEFTFSNYQSSYAILSNLWLAIGTKVASVITIGISIILLVEWRIASTKNFRWYLWVASLTLAAYPLIGTPIIAENNIVLLIPLTYILKVISERLSGKNQWYLFGMYIGIFLLGWAFTSGFLGVDDKGAIDLITYLFPSLVLIIGLYWIRWWATHPPRTWMQSIDGDLF